MRWSSRSRARSRGRTRRSGWLVSRRGAHPLLEDLPEDVRDGLDLYLQEQCGVDEDVAAFIAMYADYREQVEYINWLKSVKNIVS